MLPRPTATLALTAALACSHRSDETTAEPEPEREWCNHFMPGSDGATLELRNASGDVLTDGAALEVICGGQGLVMLPIYPHVGGFTPAGTDIRLDITLDVDGLEPGPSGHFFESKDAGFTVDCSDIADTYYSGYLNDFIPLFPPDSIPIADVDGKSGTLHVTLHAPDGDVDIDAKVVLSTGGDDLGMCGYGGL